MDPKVTRRGFFGASAGLVLASRTAQASTQVAAGLMQGEDRRKTITAALQQIDKEIVAKLRGRKSVVIKPRRESPPRATATSSISRPSTTTRRWT
jgi:hypothetical protein